MTILKAIILGIIQGFTEFLPISSSGHLILAQKIMSVEQENILFDVILHLGTLVAILIVYRKDIFMLLKKPFQKTTYFIIIATLPAVLAALLFSKQLDSFLNAATYLAPCFIITGFILLLSDRYNGSRSIDKMSYLDSLIIGIIQAFSILPGISRSGSTIFTALNRGLSRSEAAKFSFLMAIPAIGGAALLELVKLVKHSDGMAIIHEIGMMPILFGFFASLITGYFAINVLIEIIKKAKLKYFSYYLFILAALILVDQFITHIYFK